MVFEWFFTVAFSIEALVKITALGFACESYVTYLRNPWHWLDLTAVITSWISLMPGGGGSLSSIRAVRVLRPLRTVTRIPSMRMLVGALVASIPEAPAYECRRIANRRVCEQPLVVRLLWPSRGAERSLISTRVRRPPLPFSW